MPSTTSDQSDELPAGDLLARAVATWREPVAISVDFDARLNARLRAESIVGSPRPIMASPWSSVGHMGAWLLEGRTITVRPVTLVAASVVAVAVGVLGIARSYGGRAAQAPIAMSATAVTGTEVRFVLVAPNARRVSVLGDFNHWNPTATPLTRSMSGSSMWVTAVRLEPGRHVYAFVVDGTRWVTDPTAPRSLDDDFGRPSAVLTVLGGST